MRRSRTDPLALDDASVERLLSGTLPAAAAPAGYAGVARLLAATVAPPTPRELVGEAAVLAELRAVTGGRRAASPAGPARPRRRRAGLAVVVVVGALATGGVAAATGHLPGPVREAARTVLGPGGAAAPPGPAPAARGTTTAGSGGAGPGGSASTVGQGPRSGPAAAGPAAGPALEGLCQAFQEGKGGDHGGKLDAAAFAKLAAAAGGDDRVEAFCEELLGAEAKVKGPKEAKPKDPPDDPGQGQGGAPPSSGGGTGGGGSGNGGGGSGSGGSGQGQSSPVPGPPASPPNRG